MNLFAFNVADLLKNAAESDGTKQDSIWSADIKKNFQDTLDSFPKVAKCCSESFNWTPATVPVMVAENEEGINEYYVELDLTAKLASSQNVGIAEAFFMVQNYIEEEAGSDAADNTYLVINNESEMLIKESEDAAGSMLEDIKLNGLMATTEVLQDLVSKNVPIKVKG